MGRQAVKRHVCTGDPRGFVGTRLGAPRIVDPFCRTTRSGITSKKGVKKGKGIERFNEYKNGVFKKKVGTQRKWGINKGVESTPYVDTFLMHAIHLKTY